MKGLIKEINTLKESNRALRDEPRKLVERVEQLEQYSRSNNLEMKGVPSHLEPADIAVKLAEGVGEPLSLSDIDPCHRVPKYNSSETNTTFCFMRRENRNRVLVKAKKTESQLLRSDANQRVQSS